MKIGNVFATKRIEIVMNSGSCTWSAGKDKVYICLMLGVESTKATKNSELVQPSDVLNALGWFHKPKKGQTETIGDELGELTRIKTALGEILT